ncbi:hypothetical protein AaE_014145 [Aphanomyces astaci]|uniref:Phosphoribosyl-AMP cyclohydrolase domain-containing protein n=1 Tax=Aphanomyces astaci TaxID=112090 RepID=A0A6A4Z2N8_APHAT|nr:hypothetical protein AaE_014145 [Aphanomyces astaci]
MYLPAFSSWDDAAVASWGIVGTIYVRQEESALRQVPSKEQIALLRSQRVVIGPFTTSMLDEAVTWLDHGAVHIVLQTTFQELVAGIASDLPPSRVYLSVSLTDNEQLVASTAAVLRTLSSGVFLSGEAISSSSLVQFRKFLPESYRVLLTDSPLDLLATYHHQHIDLVGSPSALDAGQAFAQCLRSDRPDGLFATVVADLSGVALGLVYSSVESVVAAVAERRGIFYSRSRGGLWRKGDSSGHVQELVRLDMDCDSDAIRCLVLQHDATSSAPDTGAFCHLNTRTCWGHASGIRELQSTLQERLVSAPAGSYTKRLFDDRTLLRNKLVEEAQELAEAEHPTHVAEEAADVLYFAMVRAVAANVTFHDVETQLTMRARKLSRRPGNAKTYRIEAAAAILNGE